MFHMLSSFNLPDVRDLAQFQKDYADFVAAMKALDLVESSGPLGQRQSDTPMDTDDANPLQYFSVMTFRDRAQVDAAYAFLMEHRGPGDEAHNRVIAAVKDPLFLCWQDLA
ncbi:hypothetical protein ACTL6U_19080 [Rhodovibrionaceae bacterium A322]